MSTKPPTIALDARQCVGNYRGMGRFARNLMAALDAPYLALLARGQEAEGLGAKAVARGTRFFPAWEQAVLPRLCREHDVDVLVCPYNTAPLRLPSRVKLVLVVHDLIFMEPFRRLPPSRSAYQNMGRLYRRWVVPRVVRRADVLVTCSEYTRGLLHQRFGLRRESIVVMPSASSDALPPADQDGVVGEEAAAAGHPYVLLTGGDAPSKNAPRAVTAFAEMCRRNRDLDHRLLLLGIAPRAHARFARLAARAGVADRVRLMPYVSAAELGRLYRGAEAVFFPSLYEGFGIPALEAAVAGVPLVCSRRTSLPEIAGEAAVYVDPLSVDDMATGLGRALGDAALRERMIRAGHRQCQKFRPEVLRERATMVWQRVLEHTMNRAA